MGLAGLLPWTWEELVAGGSRTVCAKPLAVVLPTAGLALGAASLSPFVSWAFRGAPGDLESTGTVPGGLEDNLGLAEVAPGWWQVQTKTPGSPVAR